MAFFIVIRLVIVAMIGCVKDEIISDMLPYE
jgi:hypothetical protein